MSDNHEHHESHFYRGLFYGLIIGVGLVYFLKTKEGQKVKQELLSTGEDLFDDFSNRVIEFIEEEPTP